MGDFVFIASTGDKAGRNLTRSLISQLGFVEGPDEFRNNRIWKSDGLSLVIVDEEIITVEGLDSSFSPLSYIFLSKHRSQQDVPALTAHFTGNFSEDDSHGGKPGELAFTYPSLHKEYISRLWRVRDRVPGYQITIEPTHHGPTSNTKPVLFVELGSTDLEWGSRGPAEIICEVLRDTLREFKRAPKIAVAFGGTHYSEKFTNLLITSDIALGAVAPKYSLPHVDERILTQMIEKSVEKVRYAVLDWKGLGRDKERVVRLIEGTDLEIVKV